MPFVAKGEIKYYKFSILENESLYHAIFTRRGGISPSPWISLNFGASVGDDIRRVERNRIIGLSSLSIHPESVFDLYQVHSTKIVTTDRPLMPGEPHQKADAILTNQPGVTLMMRFADCVPILLFDPIKRVIGIVHAGWIGTVGQIAKNAVIDMCNQYASNPADIIAAIGPSIGPDHYKIGEDVIEKIRLSLGKESNRCIDQQNGSMFLNLWLANQIILNEVGVHQVEVSGLCTCCNLDDWYSHRGEFGKTGRFGVVMGLNQ